MRYSCKYRNAGTKKWDELENIVGDGFEAGSFRFIVLEDDTMIYLSLDTEIHFCPKRAKSIEKTMSKEAGTPIQRN